MMRVCRFCHEHGRLDQVVRYGKRHYAHYRCYLDAGRPLSALPSWMVASFPFRLLVDRGLMAEAERLVGPEDIVGTSERESPDQDDRLAGGIGLPADEFGKW